MNRTTIITVSVFALAFTFVENLQAIGPSCENRNAGEVSVNSAQLQKIDGVLADPDEPERFNSVHALFVLASRQETLSEEVLRLLHQAACDSDPKVANFASSVLFGFEMRAERLAQAHVEIGMEEEKREAITQRELEKIAAVLNNPRAPERFGTAHSLFLIASRSNTLSREVYDLLEVARADEDMEIARLAEAMLAKHDGRPMDPSFVSPPSKQIEESATRLIRRDDRFEMLTDPNPQVRYETLVHLAELAMEAGDQVDPKILNAFADSRFDSDPGIRSCAEYATERKDGDGFVVGPVYVNANQPKGEAGDQLQPLSAETGMAKPNYGSLNEYGVFVGEEQKIPIASQQPPLSHNVVGTMQHEGFMNEYGVFVGLTEKSVVGSQPQ